MGANLIPMGANFSTDLRGKPILKGIDGRAPPGVEPVA